MAPVRNCIAAALLALAIATPAGAQWSTFEADRATAATAQAKAPAGKPTSGTQIPEPADLVLFAAGVIGLLLGRRGSRSRRDRD